MNIQVSISPCYSLQLQNIIEKITNIYTTLAKDLQQPYQKFMKNLQNIYQTY